MRQIYPAILRVTRLPKLYAARLCLALIAGLMMAGAAHADFASAPATGAAVVTDGKFTDIYLFPNPSKQTWEQDLAAQQAKNSNFPDSTQLSRNKIDSFVGELSRTTYYSKLSQYISGLPPFGGGSINPPKFNGSQKTIEQCVDAAIKDAHIVNNVSIIDSHTLGTFAGCENAQSGNPSPQVNIILAPEFDVASGAGPAFGFGPFVGICGANSASAFHAFGLGIPNFTVIPTRCNQTFDQFTASISHEMVETLSDPAGFGYIHENSPVNNRFIADFNLEFNEGELADICEGGTDSIKNPNNDPNIRFTTVQNFKVSRYWSNIDSDCEPSPALSLQQAIPSQLVNSLLFDILTGDDDLRGDSTATATVAVNNSPLTFTLKQQSDHSWDNSSDHVKTFSLPAAVPLSAIGHVIITLQSHNGFGETDDNWNLQHVAVDAFMQGGYATCLTQDFGSPFARLSGDNRSVLINPTPFVGCGSLAPKAAGVFKAFEFTITTGGDDLRGDSTATLTANIGGQPRQFTLKGGNDAGWPNNSTNTKSFVITPQPISAFGNFTIALQSHNGAFESDDNWNVQAINALLLSQSGAGTCYAHVLGNPFSRLTGSQPTVTVRAFTGC